MPREQYNSVRVTVIDATTRNTLSATTLAARSQNGNMTDIKSAGEEDL
jgi:hypothetical protein